MEINTLRLKTNIVPNELPTTTKKEMWLLYRQFYTTTEMDFYQELKVYDYFSFFRHAGQLIGFVGIQIHRPILKQGAYLLLRFGAAIILEKYREQGLIQIATLKLGGLYWREVLAGRVLCWGNTFTYKSYLAFAKTAEHFYPNHQEATPYVFKEIIDAIGEHYFPKHYEKNHGIVKNDQHPLQDNSYRICHKYKEEPNIRFFSEINPEFELGHGLITIAPMNWQNVISLLKKVSRHNWQSLLDLRNRRNGLFYAKLLIS